MEAVGVALPRFKSSLITYYAQSVRAVVRVIEVSKERSPAYAKNSCLTIAW